MLNSKFVIMKYSSLLLFSFIIMLACNNKDKQGQNSAAKNDTLQQAATYDTSGSKGVYELGLKELMQINVVEDKNPVLLKPHYDLTIEDLMALNVVKKLDIDTMLTVSYDIPMEDLMKIEVDISRKEGENIVPSYEMSMEGLMEMQIVEHQKVKEELQVSYDISLDGLMKLDVCCPDSAAAMKAGKGPLK